MASSTNIVCIFFFLIILQSSLQTLARDSQFFSKVSRKPEEEQPVFNPNDDFYKNLEKDAKPIAKQPEKEVEQEPHFIPQTTHTGYGLYGHDASLDAPSTTTTTTPTSFDNNKYENKDNFNNKNQNIDSQNGKSYVPELTGLSETSYTNNVGPGKRVVNNNNNDDKNNYETFGQGKDEKNYVPELSGLSEFSYKNDVAPRKYYPENNYNSNNNNNNDNMFESNQNEKTYVPEVTGLSETSYKNNVGPRRYFPENNYNHNNNNNNNNNNDNMFGSNQNEKTAYVPELTGLSDTSYENNVGSSKYVPENNYYNYNHNHNNNNGLGKYYASTGYNGGVEKQGMSDTRYLENGKYFHDIDAEKNFYPAKNNDMSYANNNYNKYNHGQFYGYSENNHEEFNNNNKYFNRNGMQNQFPEEFEFDDQP